jgi:hypothetical protein
MARKAPYTSGASVPQGGKQKANGPSQGFDSGPQFSVPEKAIHDQPPGQSSSSSQHKGSGFTASPV